MVGLFVDDEPDRQSVPTEDGIEARMANVGQPTVEAQVAHPRRLPALHIEHLDAALHAAVLPDRVARTHPEIEGENRGHDSSGASRRASRVIGQA